MTLDWALWRAGEKPLPHLGDEIEPRFWAAIVCLRVVFMRPSGRDDAEDERRGRNGPLVRVMSGLDVTELDGTGASGP